MKISLETFPHLATVIRQAMFAAALAASIVASRADAAPIFNPANGHYYEAVVLENEANYPTWDQAKIAAETRTFRGVPGYLATITSREENDFLIVNIGPLRSPRGDLWIGGSDDPIDGEWRWVTGPEAGTLFWLGGVNGTQILYADWAQGSPNDAFGPGTESRLGWVEDGWNDLPASGYASFRPGYIVEYSGVPPDDGTYSRAPEITQLQINPDPLFVGRDGYVVTVVRGLDDGVRVMSAEYRIAGGSWQPMSPLDGAYGGNWETAFGFIGPYAEAGNYEVCVRATLDPGSVTAPNCVTAHVHSPGTNRVTGVGRITAPPVAWVNECLRNTAGSELSATIDVRRTGASIDQVEGSVILNADGLALQSDYLYQLYGENGRATLTGSGYLGSASCGVTEAEFVVQMIDGSGGSSDKARVIIRSLWSGTKIYDSGLGEQEDLAPKSIVTGDFTLTGR